MRLNIFISCALVVYIWIVIVRAITSCLLYEDNVNYVIYKTELKHIDSFRFDDTDRFYFYYIFNPLSYRYWTLKGMLICSHNFQLKDVMKDEKKRKKLDKIGKKLYNKYKEVEK